jgi:alpha-glucosidase
MLPLQPVEPPTPAVPARSKMDAQWWRQAVVYQIYPRSFADSNGDGVGDLNGILAKVGYLAELGVDAVWLSPFYPSALADGGYDVDDYRDVDPQLGNLDDFDRMVSAFRDQSIKVIVDIVPNHTSNRHHWFREALDGSPGSLARDRYIFRDGTGPDATLPPSNWQAAFGGPAWTAVGDGQWYLHLFTPEQPDLNWDNPEVHADFLQTLRFWGDRGVAGFRVDVAFALAKDMSLPLPSSAELGRGGPGSHPFYDRDEVHQIYAEWRTVFDSYQPPLMAVAEAWVPPHRRARYASPQGLGQAFNFDLLSAPWRPAQFREIISENLALALESGSSSTWVLSNHDVVRHATRYGLQSQAVTRIHRRSSTSRLAVESKARTTGSVVPVGREQRACCFWRYLAPRTYIREKNWDCSKSRRSPMTDGKTPPSFARTARSWGAMAVASPCLGRSIHLRSGSARVRLTCRSRTGSATIRCRQN